jgi:hypothetical protein
MLQLNLNLNVPFFVCGVPGSHIRIRFSLQYTSLNAVKPIVSLVWKLNKIEIEFEIETEEMMYGDIGMHGASISAAIGPRECMTSFT